MAEQDPAGPPPREAIDYLRRKQVRAGFDYRDVWREEHSAGFTVAKVNDLAVLTTIQESLAAAKEAGLPFEAWKKRIGSELAAKGWGAKKVKDPKTGQEVVVDLTSSRRLETIWRVNMGQANQAGAWERGQRSTSHPYILYRVGPSKEHRAQHLEWDGTLLPKEDPFWGAANPRNGWGCKCFTRFVSRAQYARYTSRGIPEPVTGDQQQPGRKAVKTSAPVLRPRQYTNPRTGETHTGYEGIDPGFERNPGVGRLQQLGQTFSARDRALALARDIRPQGTPVANGLDMQLKGGAAARAQRVLDAVAKIHGDGNLPKIPLAEITPKMGLPAAVDAAFGWDDISGKPGGIFMRSTPGPRPELALAHEIGHFIDYSGLPSGSVSGRRSHFASTKPGWRRMQMLMRVIRRTPTYQAISTAARAGGRGVSYWKYLRHRNELFARAYAQYVAWRSGDPVMREQLDALLGDASPRKHLVHWPYEEFLPIVEAFDRLFEGKELGWLTRT